MDTCIPCSWKYGPTLDGDVGWVGTDHGGMGTLDEGMTMVKTVDLSDVFVTGSFMNEVIDDVLLGEQKFVGLQNSRVHGWEEL